jgi:hypothetical protein
MLRTLLAAIVAAPVMLTPTIAPAQSIGECAMDKATMTFAGTPLEQATCLLRRIDPGPVRRAQPLPAIIADLMTREDGPDAAQKAAAIAAFPEPYRAYALANALAPISHTANGLPALYFVIHDTSEPFYRDQPFPKNLDRDANVNDFQRYIGPEIAPQPVAHIFLNRVGQIWAGHDFAEGWRATKMESRAIGPIAKGRMVHIETVMPRRFFPGATTRDRTYGPTPGFTKAQYRQLAALYVYASARAGRWLIPAQHNTVDAGIPDAHDDPWNFNLPRFAREIEKLVAAR